LLDFIQLKYNFNQFLLCFVSGVGVAYPRGLTVSDSSVDGTFKLAVAVVHHIP